MPAIEPLICELSRNRDTTINELQKIKEQGRFIVGAYCLFAPYELIDAAGAVPVSLCGTSEEPIAHAEKHLPRNLCPLIKSSYGYAVTGTCPYFFYSDLIIGETTCDGKKKMFELLGKIAPVHVMRLPQSNNRPQDQQQWRDEIVLLKSRLEDLTKKPVTDAALREAIIRRNRERTLARELYGYARHDPPLLSGFQIYRVLHGAGFALDRETHSKKLQTLIDAVRSAPARKDAPGVHKNPRILITGCPIGDATEKIIRIIEECGASIVCFENCGGTKDREELVNESMDPIDALAHKYVNLACSCMSPNENRLTMLRRLLDEYSVHGVIDVVLQGCHTYSIETGRIRETVRAAGRAYLTIETDYSSADEGQLRTRLGAFIEMLR